MLYLTVSGCADNKKEQLQQSTVAEESGQSEILSDNLPEFNFEEHTFKILVRNSDESVSDVWAEESSGDLMENAIYNRNLKISERFNISIEAIRSSHDNYETDALKLILANDDVYDLICPHARAAFVYAMERTLLEWNTELEYVDLDKPWWAQDAKENLSVAGKLYCMTGDISFVNFGMATCMVFNKNLFANSNIAAPYDDVRSNKWTFDKFNETIKMGFIDLNGNGKTDIEVDQFGYMTGWWGGPIQVLYSANERTVKKDESDIPYLSLNNERVIDLYEKYFNMVSNDYAYQIVSDSSDEAKNAFKSNKLLIWDIVFRDIISLRDMEVDFGIIPWPMYDESVGKYYSNVNAFSPLYIVPVTASDPSRTSVILEALAFESHISVIPTYYETALKTKHTRDNESADMLDIIKDGKLYDFGYYTDAVGIFSSTGRLLAEMTSKDFASFYSKNERASLKTLEKFVKIFTNE